MGSEAPYAQLSGLTSHHAPTKPGPSDDEGQTVTLSGTGPAEPPLQIAYLLTHYPRVALTFISGEIDAMEARGIGILPIAVNEPGRDDLKSEDALGRHARSIYLKASPARLLGSFLGALARHPLAMLGLIWLAVRSSRADLNIMVRRLVHLAYAAATARECERRGIRHLHAHFGQMPATIAWFACELLNRGGRTRASWSFTIHGFQDFVEDTVARLDLKAASASFVVCISDFTRSQLDRVSDPRYWDRYHVVRCGIDLTAFPFRGQRAARVVPRIVTVGRLSPEKGHLVLLRAVKVLKDQGVDVEVQIVGAGPFETAIRAEQDRLGIADRVIFEGEQPPEIVSSLLAEADMFCLPSFSEGLPVSIMEAMAIGVPVVTTWISGIPELAVNEVTALTVPASNAEALASALKRVAQDGALRDRMVVAARKEVERMHSAQGSGAQMAALFEPFVHGPRLEAAE